MGAVRRVLRCAGLLAWLAAGPAAGQMLLPGAVAPTPAGATQAPHAASHARPQTRAAPGTADDAPVKRGVAVAVPGIATLAGKTLALDGGASQITFGIVAKAVVATRLSLAGDKISSSREACRVDISAASLAITPLGRPNGLERHQLALAVCPVTFEVLEGAILVDKAQAACQFTEADCSVPLAGLWGPAPADLGPDQVKSLERVRATAEGAVRANYKALTASTKDRPTVMGFAHEQAQFSSSREETCRDYAEEGRHGYCSAKLTEARAAQLHDEVVVALDAKAARKAVKDAAKAARRKK